MKKLLLIFITAILVAGVGSFYGGMKYGQSKNSAGNLSRQNFQNLSPEQRQQFSQTNGRGNGSNFLAGEVIAKDAQTLTLKMQDGSSKIVLFSDSTSVSKTVDGTVSDIEVGKQIMVSGQQNSDGSFTSKTIQLSPRMSNGPRQ